MTTNPTETTRRTLATVSRRAVEADSEHEYRPAWWALAQVWEATGWSDTLDHALDYEDAITDAVIGRKEHVFYLAAIPGQLTLETETGEELWRASDFDDDGGAL